MSVSDQKPPAQASDPLARLEERIAARVDVGERQSYTARLLAKGVAKCAQKLGEEAVETAIAAVEGKKEEVVAESADLLYHLAVLWRACGVSLSQVAAELARREAQSGLDEKASRKS